MDMLFRQSTLRGTFASTRIRQARNIQKQCNLAAMQKSGTIFSRNASCSLAAKGITSKPPQTGGASRPRNSGSAAWLSTIISNNNDTVPGSSSSEQFTSSSQEASQVLSSFYEMDEALSLEDDESTTDVPEPAQKYDLSSLHEKTSHYLNTELFPVGSLNLETFEEARELIWAWSELGSLISVHRSFDLLSRLVKEQGSNFHPDLSEQKVSHLLNYITLNTVIKNWYTCWQQQDENILGSAATSGSPELMGPQDLLAKIEEFTDQCPSLGPQTKAFALIMRAVVYRIKTAEEAQYVESLLMRMVKAHRAGDNRMTPTIAEYNIVLSAMAKVKEPERAEAILTRLCDDFETGLSRLVPNAFSFGTVLFAWSHAKHQDGGQRAEAVLDTMIALGQHEEEQSLAYPSARCYTSVLKSWCDARTKPGMDRAEQFLQRMHEDFRMGNENARPTSDSYGLIIHSWSQMGYAERSEAALRLMYNDYVHNGNDLAKVTSFQFNSAISAWHRSGAPHALDRAFSLFDNMQKLNVTPDAATFGALMVSLSRSTDRSAGEKAERILREQQKQYKAGNEDCKPEALNYNAAMHCWSLVGNVPKAIALLRELLDEHKKGNARITDERPFITAFAALARSRDRNAAEEAEALFQEMTLLCDAGDLDFQPSAICYTGLQGCWASVEQPISGEKCLSLLHEMKEKYTAGDEGMRPTEANYKIVIDAFARIRNPQRAEEVWYEMLQSFLDGNPDAMPGNESCKAVLAGWLMSGAPDAIQRTIDVLERIAEVDRSDTIELKVNRNAYHLLLDICSKADNPDVLAGAEAIVRKMKEIHDEGRNAVGPDTRCYNIAINCWGKHGSAEQAEALFWDMYNEFLKNGNEDIKPDVFTISTVLTAWRRSDKENATRRAQVFFERIQKLIDMGKLNITLDSACYAALLNCLANGRTGEAADAAEAVFSDIAQRYRTTNEKTIRPTHHLYYAFIKCLANVGRLERAEELLLDMHSQHCAGHRDLEPKKHFFNLVLKGWFSSSREEAPVRAEKVLRWMDSNLQGQEKPDASNYAMLLRRWARSGLPESGKRAEALLFEMANRFGSHRALVKDCYSDVVCALARAGDAERAEELLLHMCEDFTKHKKGVRPATPHLRAFIAVLAAYSRKNPPGGLGLRVLRLVQNLREVDADDKTKWRFNSVLDVWHALPQENSTDERLTSFLAKMEEMDSRAEVQGKTESNEGKVSDDLYLSLKY